MTLFALFFLGRQHFFRSDASDRRANVERELLASVGDGGCRDVRDVDTGRERYDIGFHGFACTGCEGRASVWSFAHRKKRHKSDPKNHHVHVLIATNGTRTLGAYDTFHS